jgi:hypothetical protein
MGAGVDDYATVVSADGVPGDQVVRGPVGHHDSLTSASRLTWPRPGGVGQRRGLPGDLPVAGHRRCDRRVHLRRGTSRGARERAGTVMFTDIVASTEHAASLARLGPGLIGQPASVVAWPSGIQCRWRQSGHVAAKRGGPAACVTLLRAMGRLIGGLSRFQTSSAPQFVQFRIWVATVGTRWIVAGLRLAGWNGAADKRPG